MAGLVAFLMAATPNAAVAADTFAPPEGATTTTTFAERPAPQSLALGGASAGQQAPALRDEATAGLPEGNQWRYSEFINAVQSGKVERVRFSKDGTMLQVCTEPTGNRGPEPSTCVQARHTYCQLSSCC
jgi:cell division protease FtsH